jgi:hypothetical protein
VIVVGIVGKKYNSEFTYCSRPDGIFGIDIVNLIDKLETFEGIGGVAE